MAKKHIDLAICYDFDGTLAKGNIQEYNFIPALGIGSAEFWESVKATARAEQADEILSYMGLMLKKARAAEIPVRRQDFADFGRKVALFPGVVGWFDRINEFGKLNGIRIEHYVISSGLLEMIEATEIARKFTKIFASSFMYDYHGVAWWPALAVNYTTKTQFIFRINKGVLNIHKNEKVNKFVEKEKRPMPFERMIYIGDGDTDVPCMRLVKDQGGHSIAVYRPNTSSERAKRLVGEERAHFAIPADYRDNSKMDKVVRAIVQPLFPG